MSCMRLNDTARTYNQFTILFVQCFLLSELHVTSVNIPWEKCFETNADLVFENGVPNAFREFTHCVYIGVIFLVVRSARAVG